MKRTFDMQPLTGLDCRDGMDRTNLEDEAFDNAKEETGGGDPSAKGGGKPSHKIGTLLAIPLIAAIATTGISFSVRNAGKTEQYASFLEDRKAIGISLLGFEDTFAVWNGEEAGNDINVILTGGKIYCRGGISILPREDGNGVQILKDGVESGSIDSEISYINVCGEKLFYRDDATRDIFTYEFSNGDTSTLVEGNCGETFVYNGRVYYINLDSSTIESVDLNGGGNRVEYSHPAIAFVVVGEEAVVLGSNQTLGKCRLPCPGSDSFAPIATGVERFLVGKSIIAERGNEIDSIDVTDNHMTTQFTIEDSSALVGYCNGRIFIQKDGRLFEVFEGSEKVVVDSENASYRSLLLADDNVCFVCVLSDSEGAAIREKMLKFNIYR